VRALVTGAGGFLGRHVVERLRNVGAEVFTLGVEGSSKAASSRAFLLRTPVDAAGIETAMRAARPNLVFHLAGTPKAEPLEDTYRVNVLFGVHLLHAALRQASPPPVLLAGSAAECGPVEGAALPVTEDTTCRPVSAYGITKLAQTHHGLAAVAGQPVVMARLFNVIGGGMPTHLALGAFAAQIRAMPAEGGILRSGPLARERDFVEARPTAALLVDLLQNPAAAGKVINVCSGQATSLADLTAALVAASGRRVTMEEDASRAGNSDINRHWGSAARLASLGYRLPPPDAARVAHALLNP
jgi:nucleoside-diphosphate-sugar epimerase